MDVACGIGKALGEEVFAFVEVVHAPGGIYVELEVWRG